MPEQRRARQAQNCVREDPGVREREPGMAARRNVAACPTLPFKCGVVPVERRRPDAITGLLASSGNRG